MYIDRLSKRFSDPRSKGHDYRECRRRYLRTATNGISSKKERYNRMNNLAEAILQSTPNNSEELAALLQEAQLDRYDLLPRELLFASNTFKR